VDKCSACAQNDLDMSPALFKKFAALPVGRIDGVTWSLA
jgi:hypothetical protein